MSKPLPPYAKTARVVAGSLWIRCGDRGWNHMKRNPHLGEIVFPADRSANEYTWPVADLDVWIIGEDGDRDRVAGLCTALLQANARSVHLIDSRFRSNTNVKNLSSLSFDELRRAG